MAMVTFECLCGRLPFTAVSLQGIAAQIVAGEVQKAREVNALLPLPIAEVIDRALMREPEQRYPTMVAFAHALGSAALSAGLTVSPDPDPIGLPEFSRLLLQNNPWVSGPLAKIFVPVLAARRSVKVRVARMTSRRSRPPRALALSLLASSLVAGVMLGLRSEPAQTPATLRAPASRVERPPLAAPIAAAPVSAPPASPAQEPAPSARAVEATPLLEPAPAQPSAASVRRARRAEGHKRAQRDRQLNSDELEKDWY